jgi:hypothetical protein
MIDTVDPLTLDFPYQGGTSHHFQDAASYASSADDLRARDAVLYPHGLGEIVTASITAGFRIEALTEHLDADGPEGRPEQLTRGDDDRWRFLLGGQPIPFQYSLRAAKI